MADVISFEEKRKELYFKKKLKYFYKCNICGFIQGYSVRTVAPLCHGNSERIYHSPKFMKEIDYDEEKRKRKKRILSDLIWRLDNDYDKRKSNLRIVKF